MQPQLSFLKSISLFILFVFLTLPQDEPNLIAQNKSNQNLKTTLKADTSLADELFGKATELSNAVHYDSSNVLLEKARKIYEKVEDWAKYVKCYNWIGNNFLKKGEYENAMTFVNKALEVGLNKVGENHPEIARIYNNIGSVHLAKGA